MTLKGVPADETGRGVHRGRRRIRPARIAPLIPTWGLIAFAGVQQLGGTRWLIPFLVLMVLLFLWLFGFVARQVITARKLRKATRELAE